MVYRSQPQKLKNNCESKTAYICVNFRILNRQILLLPYQLFINFFLENNYFNW